MQKPVRYESMQEPLDDEERELMDPETWDWDNPIEGVMIGDPGVLLPIRLTFDEYHELSEAAHAQGIDTYAFIKQVVLAAVKAPAR